jgi:hypothetical protein
VAGDGWADGNHEEWDNTDIDRSAELGVSVNGKQWGRPDDAVGIAGVVNGISSAHIAHLNADRHRRRPAAASGPGADHRGLLQLRDFRLDESQRDYQFVTNPLTTPTADQ